MLKSKSVLMQCTSKHVFDKIQGMEQLFKVAHDWAGQTGQGIDITKEGFNAAVQKQCRHYFCLLPIMGNQSGFKALATLNDLHNIKNSTNFSTD